MSTFFPESELVINSDGSIFHLHLKPEQLADKVILVGDPGRVNLVASHFDSKECETTNREFHTITGQYKGKRITALSTGIGCDNIDIVMNELDALSNIDFTTHGEGGASGAHPGACGHVWRPAAQHADRHVYSQCEEYRLRRSAQLLCGARRSLRPAA